MARISLSGIVNENGISKTNYTGKGNGRLKFISRCGELWSNEIEIDDYLFYDDGISGKQTNYNIQTDRITKGVTNEGTVLMVMSNSPNYGHCYIQSSQPVFNYPLKVEFDIVDSSGSEYFNIHDGAVESRASIVNNGHYIITIGGNNGISATCDGNNVNVTNVHTVSSLTRLSFFLNGLNNFIVFKNLKIYSYVDLKHYTPISLSSSSSVIQTGETATLTAKLTNVLGEPMANTSVDFIESDAVLFKYNGRTGVTETDEFIPEKTSTTISSNGPDGTSITNNATSVEFVWANMTGTSTSSGEGDYYGDLTVECDLLSVTQEYNGIIFYEERKTGALNTIIYPKGVGHLKIVRTGNHFDAWLDDSKIINRDFELANPIRVGFRLASNSDSESVISFSDFSITGDRIISTTTDNQGVASTTIISTGVGERIFKAVSNNVESENMNIEDYIYYKEEEIISYSSDTNYTILTTLSDLPSKFELSFDYKTNGEARIGLFDVNNFVAPKNPNYSVFVGSPNGSSKWYYGVRVTSTNTTDVSASPSNYHHYTIRRNGNTFYYQRDGVGSYSKTATWFDAHSYVLGLLTWGTDKQSSVKNIILKTLE